MAGLNERLRISAGTTLRANERWSLGESRPQMATQSSTGNRICRLTNQIEFPKAFHFRVRNYSHHSQYSEAYGEQHAVPSYTLTG